MIHFILLLKSDYNEQKTRENTYMTKQTEKKTKEQNIIESSKSLEDLIGLPECDRS